MRTVLSFYLVLTVLLVSCTTRSSFITGGFSESGDSAIVVYDIEYPSGKVRIAEAFNAGPNPSFLALSTKHNLIYAINEVDNFSGPSTGGLTAIMHNGNLRNLTKAASIAVPTGGPCHLSLSPDEKYILVANYGGGSVAVVSTDEKGLPSAVSDVVVYDTLDGRKSHAHMICFGPSGDEVFVSDLGFDRILVYRFDKSAGKLLPDPDTVLFEKGTGPRHFVFSRGRSKMYVIGELNNKVSVISLAESDKYRSLQVCSSLGKETETKNYSADIHLSNDGKYLYASNRGDNKIATFKVGVDGMLSEPSVSECGGNWPRNFSIDPTGRFLICSNQKSDNITIFRLDLSTGLPAEISSTVKRTAPSFTGFLMR
jgi:6-phosphogluconolactonase